MTTPLATTLNTRRQNAHLTFKHNQHNGRHGWLRLTPAYSVALVSKILDGRKNAVKVLDPFSGTGTTALCAAYMGLQGTGLEINPFLVWFSSVKFRQFSPDTIEKARSIGAVLSVASSSSSAPSVDPPPIHNIERWWSPEELFFLCRLKAGILDTTEQGSDERDLLLVAFCRVVIKLSNAAFNHQSMSFKETDSSPQLFEVKRDCTDVFRKELAAVLESAADNPRIEPTVITGDARQTSQFIDDRFDMLITSPPYPNRMSYIRELRPYMYWMGFLSNSRDAGEYDWQAIGGTWGVATSRLAEWKPSDKPFVPPALKKSLAGISDPKNDNGALLANYVAKYFEDMWNHLSDIGTVLHEDSEVHYIVGNSTFYGTLLPVEEIFKAMLQEAGFHDVEIIQIRKRNSKAELYEFDVTGKKNPSTKQSTVREARRALRRRKCKDVMRSNHRSVCPD
jgi:DNA modification methylase